MQSGLANTGSLSGCSNLSTCLFLKAEVFCKMQPLEVSPQALSDSRHHSLEVIEQLLEQVHHERLSTPNPPSTAFGSHDFFLV